MLEVRTGLCNRAWLVFNDGGEKEVYKFKEDGTINIILSGRVTKGTWEYDPSDKTIIISSSDQSYMVHPSIFNQFILIFQVDGTNDCAFMIEENNAQNFAPKTYTELIQFMEFEEIKRLEEENRKYLEQVRKQEEEERIRIREAKDNKIINEFVAFTKKELPLYKKLLIIICMFICNKSLISFLFIINHVDLSSLNSQDVLAIVILCLGGAFFFYVYISNFLHQRILKKFMKEINSKYITDDILINKLKQKAENLL